MKPKLEIIKSKPNIILKFDPLIESTQRFEIIRYRGDRQKRRSKIAFLSKKFFSGPSRA